MTAPPVATVLVHPDHATYDPRSLRLVRVATTHPGEWPWRRLTGLSADVPAQGTDLSGWAVQPLAEVAFVMGHAS